MKIYKKCTAEPHSILVNDATFLYKESFEITYNNQIRLEKRENTI